MKYLVILTLTLGSSAMAKAQVPAPLKAKPWHHITFDDIPPTAYGVGDNEWTMKVAKSSSAMVYPFKKIQKVSRVAFEWQMMGQLKTRSAEQEKTKEGDDAPLRVGLVVYGEGPSIPFFAPAWIKALGDIMIHDSDALIYLSPGLKTPSGQTFQSPYSSSIHTQSISCQTQKASKWLRCQVDLQPAKKLAGLWIMADGDNTGSTFVTKVRRLQLQ